MIWLLVKESGEDVENDGAPTVVAVRDSRVGAKEVDIDAL